MFDPTPSRIAEISPCQEDALSVSSWVGLSSRCSSSKWHASSVGPSGSRCRDIGFGGLSAADKLTGAILIQNATGTNRRRLAASSCK